MRSSRLNFPANVGPLFFYSPSAQYAICNTHFCESFPRNCHSHCCRGTLVDDIFVVLHTKMATAEKAASIRMEWILHDLLDLQSGAGWIYTHSLKPHTNIYTWTQKGGHKREKQFSQLRVGFATMPRSLDGTHPFARAMPLSE